MPPKQIDVLARGLKVLKAVADAPGQGLQIKEVAAQTGLSYDFCLRALHTLADDEWVRLRNGGWKLGQKAVGLSDQVAEELEEWIPRKGTL